MGLNEIEWTFYGTTASKYIENTCEYLVIWDEKKAFTDKTDDDNDWDVDGATGPDGAGVWDDNDFCCSSITDGATEAYDSTVPLENAVYDGDVLLVPAMVINFEGDFYIDIAENAVGSIDGQSMTPSISSVNKGSYYETTVEFEIDTRHLAQTNGGFQAAATYWNFNDLYHNFTLRETVLASEQYGYFQDDLLSYDFEYVSYVSSVQTQWDLANEATDDDIYYDMTNPSTSDGGFQHIKYIFKSLNDYSGQVTPTATGTTPATTPATSEEEEGGSQIIPGVDNSLFFIGVAGVSVAGGIFFLQRSKK